MLPVLFCWGSKKINLGKDRPCICRSTEEVLYEQVTHTQELAVANVLAGKEESFESLGAVPKTEKKLLAPVPLSGA